MSEVNIEIKDNGPLLVQGEIKLIDGEGQAFDIEKPVIALCRCGASENKPFCDGKHVKIGFKSAERTKLTTQNGV